MKHFYNFYTSTPTPVNISVIHPTCRPEQAIKVRQQWLDACDNSGDIEYLFGASFKDQAGLKGCEFALSKPVHKGYSTAVANYNAAAERVIGKIFICAQDDITAPKGWDTAIKEALEPYLGTPKLLHVCDGFTKGKLMVIMCGTREYLQRGELLCSEYDGWYSDTEFSIRAYDEPGLVVDGRHIKFFHDHPAFTGRASDEAYMMQQSSEAQLRNKLVFIRRNYNAAVEMGLI